ncbi:hypothetical protein [Actinotalea sp.]|uniref:hypothetical protein n=1 Tax=Actinotalea sp. TaxID=1872145 RepID=UPI003565A5A3
MTGPDPLADRVLAAERSAHDQLTAALSGAPLCRVDGTGTRSAKHWEGRSAAMAEVRRDLTRAARAEAGTDEQAIIRRRLAEWQERAATSTLMSGPAWTAYLQGGISALTELVDEEPAPIVEHR